ncbi:MAG TPA: hypothetical protein VHH11_13290 [Gammaproteobacteria bacterium]|jgi:hypothetical protein|nr:hypothetical protein [Gammaproteobacteria bacterium]
MSADAHREHLDHLRELNRLFLDLLQLRVRTEGDCLGFPEGACAALLSADGRLLDAVAAFPHALFRVEFEWPLVDHQDVSAGGQSDARQRELALSILLAARQTSRQSPYQARFSLGLEVAQIQVLRSMSLLDVQRLACVPGVLTCAFAETERLWCSLLTDTRPESRRQLTLLALQPRLARDWPRRRPARPVA